MTPMLSPSSLDVATLGVSGLAPGQVGANAYLTAAQKRTMTPQQQRLMGAAQDFEGILISQMLTAMRSAHLAKDPLDSGNASNIMHSMLDAQMGKDMAHSSSFGLADAIYRELSGAMGSSQMPSGAAASPPSTTASTPKIR